MNLLCIGEVMLELSTALPFANAVCFEKNYAGDAFNTAMTAHHLGIETGFLTRLGTDVFSEDVLQLMKASGLVTDWVRQVSGKPLGLYLATYNDQGDWQAQYYRKDSVATTLHPDDLPYQPFFNASQIGLRAVYGTGITLSISASARDTVYKAFAQARAHNLLTCFDINYRPALWPRQEVAIDTIGRALEHVDVLSTSLHDVQQLLGLDQPAHILEYCYRKGVRWLVLRLGEDGCLLGHVTGAQHHFLHLPNPWSDVRIKHPIGAGDAFNAGLLTRLIKGATLEAAAMFALELAQKKLQADTTVFLPNETIAEFNLEDMHDTSARVAA